MTKDFFKVPKQPLAVTLWVHPEGRVLGDLFVREQGLHHAGLETIDELMNQSQPFVVVYRDDLDEFRFYNKSSIVRVEYDSPTDKLNDGGDSLDSECHMMDGSVITGIIKGDFPADQRRLYDHMNNEDFQFIPLRQDHSGLCLINKNYIIYTKSL